MRNQLLLLMMLITVGNCYSKNFFYIDPLNISFDDVGKEIRIPVKAHFDTPASAFQVYFDIPYGLELVYIDKGNGMTNTFYNARGRIIQVTANLSKNNNIVIGTYLSWIYDEYGNQGVAYWQPGEYAEMFILYLKVTEDYRSGDVFFSSMTAMGYHSSENPLETIYDENLWYYCDTDCDGAVAISDVSCLLDYLLGNPPVYAQIRPNGPGDVYRDGSVDLVDMIALEDLLLTQNFYSGYEDMVSYSNHVECSLEVQLPEEVNLSDYHNMLLYVSNDDGGKTYHYTITDKTSYKFVGIDSNSTWNVTLTNQYGDELGRIENVEVGEEDVKVSFPSLKMPQSVTLNVKLPSGQDVTGQAKITWLDDNGEQLKQGNTINGLPKGRKLNYCVKLPQELATAYTLPANMSYTVKDGTNIVVCQLTEIAHVTLNGRVKDAAMNQPLFGATISATQLFAEGYTKTLTTRTDDKGYYSMDALSAPTTITIAAPGYITKTINCDSQMTGDGNITLPDVVLQPITGTVVSVNLTYTPAHVEGEEAETQNWYNDYNNVDYSVYNKTAGHAINNISIQYPQIVLMEDVSDGDALELTATSCKDAFMPVKTAVTVAEQKATAKFNISEMGKMEATFKKNSNPEVTGILYDINDKLVTTADYTQGTLRIDDLADGNYKLVTMGRSDFFNSIYNLNEFANVGLIEGTDYVKNNVNIKNGIISQLVIDEVPFFDESKLYYTGNQTFFLVNKPNIVIGNYLTFSAHVDFKEQYANKVNDVQLVFELPESCSFVENSVMVGAYTNTSGNVVDGNRITVPIFDHNTLVRFCAIPTTAGDFAPSAYVQFKLNGKTIIQPIGNTSFTADALSISLPSTVSNTNIPISGTAGRACDISIYDNDVLIGQTKSLANGSWMTNCELYKPYNLSRHNIYAKVTPKQGLELKTETEVCTYDKFFNEVSRVHMLYNGNNLIFDYQNPNSSNNYYSYVPGKSTFTFTIDFINNDSSLVRNVILYVKTSNNQWTRLNTTYDAQKNCWIAKGEFTSGALPVNVSVDYDYLSHGPISRQALIEAKFDYYNYKQEVENIRNEVDSLIASTSNLSIEEFEDIFNTLFGTSVNSTTSDLDNLSIDEILNYADLSLAQSDTLLDEDNINNGWKQFLNQTEYGTIDLSSCGIDGTIVTEKIESTITPELLIERGFSKIEIDDNSDLYELVTDNKYMVVDFVSNTYRTLSYNENTNLLNRVLNSRSNDIQILIDQQLIFEEKVSDLIDLVGNINVALSKIPDFFKNKVWSIDAQIATNRDTYQALRQSITQDMPDEQVARITEKVEKLIQENCKLGQEKRLLNATLKKLEPAISKITSVVSALCDAYGTGNNLREYINLWFSVPYCGCSPERTTSLQNAILNSGLRCAAKDIANIVGDMILLHSIINSAAAAVPTGGQSLIVTAASIALSIGKGMFNDWSNNVFAAERAKYRSQAIALGNDKNCNNCPDPDPDPNPNPHDPNPHDPNDGPDDYPKGDPYPGNDAPFGIDPSGFVYEGVPSNRLHGVTATCYYKETVEDMYGDLHEEVVLWDAEQYNQENPLLTDENGFYRWDVPIGMWQVKYEKEGYETTYSDWLPVPPPQLDVNIGMVQMRQPEVIKARAYPQAVEMEFDKFMFPETLTTDNIAVSVNGNAVSGTIEMLNAEVDDPNAITSLRRAPGTGLTFASKVRFNADRPFNADHVTLHVKHNVESYAGLQMNDNYEAVLDVEYEMTQIVADTTINVMYGDSREMTVTVLPAKASRGKVLNVRSISPMIVTTDTEVYTLDSNGKAVITVNGELPGMSSLLFDIDGYNLRATTLVNVKMESEMTVATPTASIASGSEVEKGTAVYLYCKTEGATIYYTLDGSCPCDNTEGCMVYDGTPIIINSDVTIKAMATCDGLYESNVATLVYHVSGGDGIDEMKQDNNSIMVYPVPVRDELIITAGGKMIESVILISINGSIVASTQPHASMTKINVSGLSEGFYIVKVTTGDKAYTRKIVKTN